MIYMKSSVFYINLILLELVNHILIHLFLITKLIYPIKICVDLTETGQVAASLYMFAILLLLSIVKIYRNLILRCYEANSLLEL